MRPGPDNTANVTAPVPDPPEASSAFVVRKTCGLTGTKTSGSCSRRTDAPRTRTVNGVFVAVLCSTTRPYHTPRFVGAYTTAKHPVLPAGTAAGMDSIRNAAAPVPPVSTPVTSSPAGLGFTIENQFVYAPSTARMPNAVPFVVFAVSSLTMASPFVPSTTISGMA